MPYTPQPGDIGLAYSTTMVGRLVRLLQSLIGGWAIFSHAFIVLYDGDIIESMPRGARFGKLSDYDPDQLIFSYFNLTEHQRYSICDAAIRMHGTKYSFLDYLAIGVEHYFHDRLIPRLIRKRVNKSSKMICSQLVVETYRRAGIDLLEGGNPQSVTPAELGRIIMMGYGKNFPESS